MSEDVGCRSGATTHLGVNRSLPIHSSHLGLMLRGSRGSPKAYHRLCQHTTQRSLNTKMTYRGIEGELEVLKIWILVVVGM